MTTSTWTSTTSGNWATAADWSGDVEPSATSTVVIATSAAETVSITSNVGQIANFGSLAAIDTLAVGTGGFLQVLGEAALNGTLDATGGEIEFSGVETSLIGNVVGSAGTMTADGGTVTLYGTADSFTGNLLNGSGTFAVAGTISISAATTLSSSGFAVQSGSLSLAAAGRTYAGVWAQTGGTVSLNGGLLSLTGIADFLGGVVNTGGELNSAGTALIGGGFAIGGSVELYNSGTLMESSNSFSVGAGTADTAALVNASGATLSLIGSDNIINANGAATIDNYGLLTCNCGADGYAYIYPVLVQTGTLSVLSGQLVLSGAGTTIGGLVSGAGTLVLEKGTIESGASLTVSNLEIGSATLAASLTYHGVLTQEVGTLTLGANTLTATGGASLYSVAITGSGEEVLSGAVDLYYGAIEATATVDLQGLTNQLFGNLDIGASATDQARLVNTGTYQIAGNLNIDNTGTGTVSNSGTIAKVSGVGASTISPTLIESGVLIASTGTLALAGAGNSLGGVIGGDGVVDLSAGSDTLNGNLSVVVGTLGFTGANISSGGNFNYVGNFTQSGGTWTLNGDTAVFYNNAIFTGGQAAGSGVIAAAGATGIDGYTLAGTTVFSNNAGLLTQGGSLSIGNVSGDSAEAVNQSGATWDIAGDVSIGDVGSGTIDNYGTLAKTNGAGISTIAAALNNTGVLSASFGTIALTGTGGTLGGIIGGNTVLQFAGGSDLLESGLALVTATTREDGATLTLGGNLSYVGSLYFDSGTLDLNSFDLILYNTVDFTGGTASGAGAIATLGSTVLNNLTLTAGAAFSNNSGTVDQQGLLYLGAVTGDTSSAINQAGATWILNGFDNEILGTGTASFINAGTLVTNALLGNGSEITSAFTNTGSVAVADGYIELGGSSDLLGGTISGPGGIFQYGGTATLEAGLTLTVGQIISSDGATLTLAANETYGGQFYESSTLALGSSNLSLTGGAQLAGADITGTGTLATSGTTNIGSNTTLAGSIDLTNTGLLQVTNSSFSLGAALGDTATIVNAATGTIDLSNDSSIDGLASATIRNSGLIIKADGAGNGTIEPTLINTGTITDTTGGLVLTAAVSGAGTFNVGTGAVLYAEASVASGSTVNLVGTASQLVLATPDAFAGAIAGFANSDFIQVAGFTAGNFTSAFNATTDVLTLTNGSGSANLQFIGSGLSLSSFTFETGNNGLAIGHV
jgi:hypothetical protein